MKTNEENLNTTQVETSNTDGNSIPFWALIDSIYDGFELNKSSCMKDGIMGGYMPMGQVRKTCLFGSNTIQRSDYGPVEAQLLIEH